MDRNARKATIDRISPKMNEGIFKEMVFDGWKAIFQERLEKLIMDKFGPEGLKELFKNLPWDNYNLFTGYKHRFYFSDDPIESAETYFAENASDFGTVEIPSVANEEEIFATGGVVKSINQPNQKPRKPSNRKQKCTK